MRRAARSTHSAPCRSAPRTEATHARCAPHTRPPVRPSAEHKKEKKEKKHKREKKEKKHKKSKRRDDDSSS